jgi:hypothetical protein
MKPFRDRDAAVPFYLIIQRILLTGVHLPPATPEGAPIKPPPALQEIAAAVLPTFEGFNVHAVRAGNRYRSAFWAIYLLSAGAVVCAVLPLALNGSYDHAIQEMMGHVWGIAEVAVMAVVGILVWSGRRNDWQGQWLTARTKAEMTWYLPLLAPLVPFSRASEADNWYARVFDGDDPFAAGDEVDALCRDLAPHAGELLAAAWQDTAFVAAYAQWAAYVIEGQRRYHARLAARNRTLLHRTHRINTVLFTLTAAGALAHLFSHASWLLLLTIFCPALGASLHGAMAQSEAYRLATTSERLAVDLGNALQRIEQASGALEGGGGAAISPEALREAVTAAIALLLNEHQDWHMLVRPHHLPLA